MTEVTDLLESKKVRLLNTFSDFYRSASSYGLPPYSVCNPKSIQIRAVSRTDESSSYTIGRIYFISYPQTIDVSNVRTLFCVNLTHPIPSELQLTWYPLLSNESVDREYVPSMADILLRERMRVSTFGMTDFCLCKSGKIVFLISSRLYLADDSTNHGEPPHLLEPKEAPLMDTIQPVTCPVDDNLIICFSNNNIVLGHLSFNKWTYLTQYEPESDISGGMPPFVIQEEFSRYIGYWWRPVKENGRYQLLFEEVDERAVSIVHLMAGGDVETHRYPRAGTTNAASDLKICEFELDCIGKVTHLQYFALRCSLKNYLPEFEYLVDAGWTPDGKYVWCQMLSRLQDHLSLILIPLDNFCVSSSVEQDPIPLKSISPCIVLVDECESQYWVKVDHYLTFLNEPFHLSNVPKDADCSTNSQLYTFIWASHRTGYKHLYLIHCTVLGSDMEVETMTDRYQKSATLVHAKNVTTYPLTKGNWEVTNSKIWIDEQHCLIYFHSTKFHPILRNVYAVSYANPANPVLSCLTSSLNETNKTTLDRKVDNTMCSVVKVVEDLIDTNCLDPVFHNSSNGPINYPMSYELEAVDFNCGLMVLSSSSLARMKGFAVVRIELCQQDDDDIDNKIMVFQPKLKHLSWILHHKSHFDSGHNTRDPNPPLVLRTDCCGWESSGTSSFHVDNHNHNATAMNVEQYNSTDSILYGLLFLPSTAKPPPRGFPTIHYVYGGPDFQLVRGFYLGSLFELARLFCGFGYALFFCDCRGSSGRGIRFEGFIKNKLGQVELDDHVGFLRCIANKTGLIDLNRVGIMGCSYGGYITLMAALRYQHVYKAAAAISAVVDWRLYDTAYTERYLGLPRVNTTAYQKSSALQYVSQMPATSPRLLICHGGQDENVHFTHAASLLQELASYGKPYQFQYYPTSRHTIADQWHLNATLLNFFQQLLHPA